MATLWENFSLGIAGLEDEIGITHDAAAAVYTSQSVADNPSLAGQESDIYAAAVASENGGGLSTAASATGAEIVAGVESVVSLPANLIKSAIAPIFWPLILVAVGVAAWYLAPELKILVGAGARAAQKKAA